MGLKTATEPLTNGIWHLLVALWPLWLLCGAILGVRLLRVLIEQRRLAKSGIADIDKMDGLTFERYLEGLFRRLGYAAERTQTSGDFGADLILTRDGVRTIVQAKRYAKPVGVKAVQEVVAARQLYNGAKTLVVTNASYSRQAQRLAAANSVELWDRARLITAILKAQRPTAQAAVPQPSAGDNTAAPVVPRDR